MKISVLMPTYNDSENIEETLDSILTQTYKNWELIIIDDGSKDNTKKVVQNYIKKNKLELKCIYIYQSNSDQLKAIINGSSKINGDLIYILHSDDLLNNSMVFQNAVDYFNRNPQCDSIIADLNLINENSHSIGRQKVFNYKRKKYLLALSTLWLGRNLLVDVAFHKKAVFLNQVKESYLTWNLPFWISYNESKTMLNIKKVDFPFIKYRVHSGNYINNEIGKLNVINGELRTLIWLMSSFEIPFYKIQFYIYRIFVNLKLGSIYRPIYINKATKKPYNIIKFILKKRFDNQYESNEFLSSLLAFYNNFGSSKYIDFDKIYDYDKIYIGNEMRAFNNNLLKKSLPKIYYLFFEEMKSGFKGIKVSKNNYSNALNICKFLCIYPYVDIRVEK